MYQFQYVILCALSSLVLVPTSSDILQTGSVQDKVCCSVLHPLHFLLEESRKGICHCIVKIQFQEHKALGQGILGFFWDHIFYPAQSSECLVT